MTPAKLLASLGSCFFAIPVEPVRLEAPDTIASAVILPTRGALSRARGAYVLTGDPRSPACPKAADFYPEYKHSSDNGRGHESKKNEVFGKRDTALVAQKPGNETDCRTHEPNDAVLNHRLRRIPFDLSRQGRGGAWPPNLDRLTSALSVFARMSMICGDRRRGMRVTIRQQNLTGMREKSSAIWLVVDRQQCKNTRESPSLFEVS